MQSGRRARGAQAFRRVCARSSGRRRFLSACLGGAIGLLPASSGRGGAVGGTAPLEVVASFSILGDMTARIGGGEIALTTLVGPGGDVHVFEPSPADARALARARLVVVNGLGLEGWLTRLIGAAGYRGRVATATSSVAPLIARPSAGRGRDGLGPGSPDPHAWQDVRNAIRYAGTIAEGLAAADPEHAALYRERERRYAAELAALDTRVRDAIAAIPAPKRKVITTHDAFRYYGEAYGVTFIPAAGISTAAEPAAGALAALLRQIRESRIKALFLEAAGDPRLMRELARDADAALGPPLYADTLSPPDGPAPSYIRLIETNTAALRAGMLMN